METYEIVLIVVGCVIALGLISLFIPPLFIANNVYKDILVRTSKDKWGHECSAVDDAEQMEMYARGEDWGAANEKAKEVVWIVSDGFNLYGEYFDFGHKKAVIIIPGRTEACDYSYYFAKPYAEAGYNVLVIDNRCHGYSDGTRPALGLKEYRDILAWGKLLNEKYGNDTILCHGICIGSATALYALVSEDCPDYMAGMVCEGMYTTFKELFKNHLIVDKRPVFPFLGYIMMFLKTRSGANPTTDGPIYRIKKLNKPILFLYGKQDVFARPDKSEELYNACAAPKQIAWFDKGGHSHLRINNEEEYDGAIRKFCDTYFD